jgi:hypothetical protein
MIATPASADDPVVATVNDRPIYGSCVTAQAARGATKQQALDQCIGFELLAQRAAKYATDPEVAEATTTALVSQFIAREYEDKYTKPSDFGDYWTKSLERNKQMVEHGEARASAYIRVPFSKTPTPEEIEAKHAFADEIAKKLADQRGLTAPDLQDLATQLLPQHPDIQFQAVPAYLDNGGLVEEYARALFSIPEVGRTSAATRTPYGWDVILFSEVFPAEHLSPDEVVKKMLPEVKRSYFSVWSRQIASGVSVKLYDQNVGKLENL